VKDLFDIFLHAETIEVDDLADYQVALIDTEDPYPAAMAVTALTLYQLEHEYDRGRLQMILWALSTRCADEVQVRAMVGLLLIIAHNGINNTWVLEQLADVLSYHDELAYDAWMTLLEMTKPEVYDHNYAVLKDMYNTHLFTEHPKMFFEPFERGIVEDLDDYEWKLAELFFRALNVCDSDMYVMMLLLKQFLPSLAQQLKDDDIDLESMEDMDIKFQQMMMISNGKDHIIPREEELSEVENYVMQLYRYINLSPHSKIQKGKNIRDLRSSMVDRMIIVGAARKLEAEEI